MLHIFGTMMHIFAMMPHIFGIMPQIFGTMPCGRPGSCWEASRLFHKEKRFVSENGVSKNGCPIIFLKCVFWGKGLFFGGKQSEKAKQPQNMLNFWWWHAGSSNQTVSFNLLPYLGFKSKERNPAYGRHQISWPMQIVAPIFLYPLASKKGW